MWMNKILLSIKNTTQVHTYCVYDQECWSNISNYYKFTRKREMFTNSIDWISLSITVSKKPRIIIFSVQN